MGLRPQKILKRVLDVHPEVSDYPPSPPDTVARCAVKAHPSLGGASHLVEAWKAYLGEVRGQWNGGWHVSKLSFGVE